MEKKIDCRGMACPLPVVNAKKAAEELGAGDVLTVLVDNEIAVQNLTRFGEHKGFTVSAEKNGDAEFAVIMNIAEAAAEAAGEGDVVILSPASTSFDRFANFMERGRVFKELVNALP